MPSVAHRKPRNTEFPNRTNTAFTFLQAAVHLAGWSTQITNRQRLEAKIREIQRRRVVMFFFFVFINRVTFLSFTYYWIQFIVPNVKRIYETETTIELQKELFCEVSKDYEILFYYEFNSFAVSIKLIVAQSIIIC